MVRSHRVAGVEWRVDACRVMRACQKGSQMSTDHYRMRVAQTLFATYRKNVGSTLTPELSSVVRDRDIRRC